MTPSMEFPFPTEKEGQPRNSDLPPFPKPSVVPSTQTIVNATSAAQGVLTTEEIRQLRVLLGLFRLDDVLSSTFAQTKDNNATTSTPAGLVPGTDSPRSTQPTATKMESFSTSKSSGEIPAKVAILSSLKGSVEPGIESATLDALRALIEDIGDEKIKNKLESAVAGLMPLQQFLRHSTPEQKQSVLCALTDRFLKMIAGVKTSHRRDILQTVAAYASGLSGMYTFLQGEGDPFNNQYYERVEGSDVTSKQIQEIHGFMVIKNETRLVSRLGRALT